MVCALDGKSPWARYTSTDPNLMTWKLADATFTRGVNHTAALAGALFHKVPGAPPGGPTHMINANTGSAFWLGNYDSTTEVMTITSKIESIESGGRYHWAAISNEGPDPDTDSGRLLTVAWVGNNPSFISLIREISYDTEASQLISYPVEEYNLLHNDTYFENKYSGVLHSDESVQLEIPDGQGGSLDLYVSFEVSSLLKNVSKFGVVVRAPSDFITQDITTEPLAIWFQPKFPGSHEFRVYWGKEQFEDFILLDSDTTLDIRVLVDKPATEVYIQRGRLAHVFADTDFSIANTSAFLFNGGSTEVVVANASAYGMACAWIAD
eukprot:m.346453 g.346453  ORF g.346453 m.346453 type:complete len:323 (-) comp29248_c0_seq1:40-1008(-)